MKLFLKGDRCFKDKCAIERRNYAPGQHGRRRSKVLGYGIQLREKSRKNDQIRQAVETASGRGIPAWLQLNPEQFSGTVLDVPKREDIRLPIQEQLIVELYSK